MFSFIDLIGWLRYSQSFVFELLMYFPVVNFRVFEQDIPAFINIVDRVASLIWERVSQTVASLKKISDFHFLVGLLP